MEVLYQDKTVTLTAENVTILNYYFYGLHKTIPIQEIKEIKLYNLTIWLKYRLAGFSYAYRWHYFPYDFKRSKKEMFIAIHLDSMFKPCLTPERPREFFDALSKLVPKSTDTVADPNSNEEEMDGLKKQ